MEDYRIYEKLGPAKYLYMSALNKINNTIKLLNLHAGNLDIHVTEDDKKRWDAKLDSNMFGNLTDLTGRVTALETEVSGIPTKTSQLVNDSGFITNANVDFSAILLRLTSAESSIGQNSNDIALLKQGSTNQVDLSEYVKFTNLTEYALKTDLSQYALKTDLSQYALKSSLLEYVKPSDLKTINGISLVGSGDILIDGSSTTSTTYTVEQWFFVTDSNSTPSAPVSSDPSLDGWSQVAANISGDQHTWMVFRWNEVGGSKGAWQGPFVISGKNGENGIDGDKIEYIYAITLDETIAPTEITNISDDGKPFQDDDFVPTGWWDNPQGISVDKKCEWMAFRTKTYNEATKTYSWGQFVGPTPWSIFGKQGIDGDGVEYIYCVNSVKPTGTNDPSSWTSDELFNTNEYIKTGTIWKDDPVDLSMYDQGSRQWVSSRKKVSGVWQAYSTPALWTYYAIDGLVDGVTIDADNNFIGVPLNSDGTNGYIKQVINVSAFNGIDSISDYTVTVTSVNSDKDVSVSSSYFTVNADNKSITAIIPEGAVNFATTGNLSIVIRCNATVNSATVIRYCTVQFAGIHIGEDGSAYQLCTDVKTIKRDASVNNPSSITVWCKKIKADTVLANINPSDSDSVFTFWYYVNGDEATITQFTTNTISTSSATISITVVMKYNSIVVDKETIYVIKDGIPGASAVSYQIELLSDGLVGQYDDSDVLTYSGQATFKIAKKEGTNPITYLDSSNVTISSGEFTTTYSNYVFTLTATGSEILTNSSAIVVIVKDNTNTTTLCSAAIPVNIKGKQGEPGVTTTVTNTVIQPLDAVVTRVTVWTSGGTYYASEAAPDGYKYQDFVAYGNYYYKCIVSISGSTTDPDTDTQHWEKVTTVLSSAYIENLITETGLINDLTAHNVVITKADSTVVAGMTSGSSVPTEIGSTTNTSGIRIWAGTTTGDLNTAPFTVDESGHLKATDAEISGTINATSGTFDNITVKNATLYNNIAELTIKCSTSDNISQMPFCCVVNPKTDMLIINNYGVSDASTLNDTSDYNKWFSNDLLMLTVNEANTNGTGTVNIYGDSIDEYYIVLPSNANGQYNGKKITIIENVSIPTKLYLGCYTNNSTYQYDQTLENIRNITSEYTFSRSEINKQNSSGVSYVIGSNNLWYVVQTSTTLL